MEIDRLSDVQIDYLIGALLGDGSLIKGRHDRNAQFSYISKSKQHVRYIYDKFENLSGDNGIKRNEYIDARTGKKYGSYRFRTLSNRLFTEYYALWYVKGKKHLPDSLILNPTICLIWYIGDGGISHGNRCESIKLSTHCFTKDEQERILLPQLSQFNAVLQKAGVGKGGSNQYFIYIPHKSVQDFLDYIGECPFEDYRYKWSVKPYKNFCSAKNPETVEKIIDLFCAGYSSNYIAKQIGVDRTTVIKYLSQNGYDYRDNLYKRKKEEIDVE